MGKPREYQLMLLTDIHLRSDYIPGFLDKQIETLIKLVNKKPPDGVVINGDIFHKRNPHGQELLAFGRLLDSLKCKEIYVNTGNHDRIKKDGSSCTTLSLFSDKARIITESETINIGGVNFDFIPHYEDEAKIVQAVKKSKNHMFGHFGFEGCVSNGAYLYESKLKKFHFPKDKLSFLGHIHKPKIYDGGKNNKIYVLGTQYSNSFGESNTKKFLHTLVIGRDKSVRVVRKPIDIGIRHITGTIDELAVLNKKFKFDNFFTILRLSIDRLDEYVERQLHEKIIKDYKIAYLDIAFEDILPKFVSDYAPDQKIFTLDEGVINDYLDSKDSIFSKDELLDALKMIKEDEN